MRLAARAAGDVALELVLRTCCQTARVHSLVWAGTRAYWSLVQISEADLDDGGLHASADEGEATDRPAADTEAPAVAKPAAEEPIADDAETADAAADATNGDVPAPVVQSVEGAEGKAADASKKEGKAKKAKGEAAVRHCFVSRAVRLWRSLSTAMSTCSYT